MAALWKGGYTPGIFTAVRLGNITIFAIHIKIMRPIFKRFTYLFLVIFL